MLKIRPNILKFSLRIAKKKLALYKHSKKNLKFFPIFFLEIFFVKIFYNNFLTYKTVPNQFFMSCTTLHFRDWL